MKSIDEIAAESFGIPYVFPLQRLAISNILDAVDADGPIRQMVLLPTGFGKSICFQLPSQMIKGITLVIYPLLALMNDQKRSLDRKGIRSVVFKGGLEQEEWRSGRESLESGAVRLVITNPETLATPRMQEVLSRLPVFHAAIDEAHCVSEWGETFRPAYLKLGEYLEILKPRVTSAFTATASPMVAKAIASHLFSGEPYRIVSADIDKPNIRYSVEETYAPLHTLTRLISTLERPSLVFSQSRNGVRLLCEKIRERTGLDSRFYHAGLEREEKREIEEWFMASCDGILCATCAYGMGVDKSNIRTVVHFGAPASVEAYIQEAGRGGRDGGHVEAVLVRDLGAPEHVPAADTRDGRRQAFMKYTVTRECRRQQLLSLMGGSLAAPCSGCDVCDGAIRALPEGVAEIVSFFSVNSGRFKRHAAATMLGMARIEDGDRAARPTIKHLPCAGSGCLRSWDRSDISSLVGQAIFRRIIVEGPEGHIRLPGSKDRLCLEV